MKIIRILLFVLMCMTICGNCAAQTTEVADSLIQTWWKEYPSIRPQLRVWFPDLFVSFSQVPDSTMDVKLFDYWKLYDVDNGMHYVLVQKVNSNYYAIVDLGDRNQGYVKTFIGADSVLVISPDAINSVPAWLETIIEGLEPEE